MSRNTDTRLHLERLADQGRHPAQQLVGVQRVDRNAAELDDEFVVVRALHRVLDARVRADAAHRGDHEVRVAGTQRAQSDLDHHLAAVGTPGHQFEFAAHRARFRRQRIGLAVGGVARCHPVGHQAIHRQAFERVDAVAEQGGGRRVGQHDQPLAIDQQHAVWAGVEHLPEELRVVPLRSHPALTGATRM